MLARYKDNEVNEKDLEDVVENTNALILQHYINEFAKEDVYKVPKSLVNLCSK